ncbi:hypothetical protein L2D08_13685 [Domibacillus sp. PGB-M46]|uniref:hypothetical protein n=1 Tax=Domibacillus sp. PGB-M46 TaxID=2910255 RepID=UPI001F564233|nr:hypothetical protein [Domibacillus sp. PGB-M46]MCI2255420.1 hypothetical protein [Domibacillus sp. PGB-M46]
MKIKQPLLKATAPALALGLAFGAQADAEAANVKTAVQASVGTEAAVKEKSGGSILHRLNPVEKRVSSIESELAIVASGLESTETLTSEEYDGYLSQLNSLLNRTNAATNQLNAVAKKSGEETPEVIEVENKISDVVTQVLDTQNLLGTIEIVPETPELELPEEGTVEEPIAPVEEGTDETEVPEEDTTETATPEEGTVEEPVAPVEEGTDETEVPEEETTETTTPEETVEEPAVPVEEGTDEVEAPGENTEETAPAVETDETAGDTVLP